MQAVAAVQAGTEWNEGASTCCTVSSNSGFDEQCCNDGEECLFVTGGLRCTVVRAQVRFYTLRRLCLDRPGAQLRARPQLCCRVHDLPCAFSLRYTVAHTDTNSLVFPGVSRCWTFMPFSTRW